MLGPLTYGVLSQSTAAALWTPTSPTTGGGVSPLVWKVPAVENYQDDSLTTPATSIGDPVGSVDNQGSDNFFVSQSTTANKPTLQQVTVNSVTSYIWRFDGANDYLVGTFGGGAISPPVTVFSVARLDPTAVNDNSIHALIDSQSALNRMAMFQAAGPTPDVWAINNGANVNGSATNSNYNIWTGLYSGGASSQLWINGVSQATGDAGNRSPVGITIGAFAGPANYWKGDIGQILIYPGNLSTADKNEVGEYLERVTGIVWTTIT